MKCVKQAIISNHKNSDVLEARQIMLCSYMYMHVIVVCESTYIYMNVLVLGRVYGS